MTNTDRLGSLDIIQHIYCAKRCKIQKKMLTYNEQEWSVNSQNTAGYLHSKLLEVIVLRCGFVVKEKKSIVVNLL